MALSIEQQVMAYLIQCAIERRTTTYEEVATRFDLPTTWPRLSQTVSPILYRIFDWCEKKRLPKLTVLVVRKSGADIDLPGLGFWKVSNLPNVGRREKVLLTEMWTADVYHYFDIDVSGFEETPVETDVKGRQLGQEEALDAILRAWASATHDDFPRDPERTREEARDQFNVMLDDIHGPDILRMTFPEHLPNVFTFERKQLAEWVEIKANWADVLLRPQFIRRR